MHVLLQIPRQLLIYLVRGYQLIISPHVPTTCRYHPSCSNYAIQALRKYGVLKGLILATWRILRCNPWTHRHGFDPPHWFGEPAPTEEEYLKSLHPEASPR